MDVREALKGQYHGAMAMLRDTIERCPKEMWNQAEEGAGGAEFWRVVYHTLFFTHFYLQENAKAFTPWEKHRDKCQNLGLAARRRGGNAASAKPYTKRELMTYWRICDRMVDKALDTMDLDAKTCGFYWYRMPKLDHQLVNIRHIQHHAAILAARLRRARRISVGWVGAA